MIENDALVESGQYPTRWSGYIGQEPAKEMLRIAAHSARIRKQPMDHVLIAHPTPGIGKTALAVLTAAELRRPVRVAGEVGPFAARMLFAQMNDGDVLFIDEIHKIGKAQSEWLLSYLQDGVILGPLGPEVQPRVTIIGATTHPQKLPEAVVSRFVLPPMQEYTLDEAARIAQVLAKRLLVAEGLPPLRKPDATVVARAGSCNPRAMRQLLITLRDMTVTGEFKVTNGRYDVAGLLRVANITDDGLDRVMQRYLVTLGGEFSGNAGAAALEDRLAQAGGLGTVERVLMDKGLLAKTRSGRTLTQAGIRRYQELVA